LSRRWGQAGAYVAKSIKIAEIAKILENTPRDINFALMNELALICDLMKIRTKDVLEAAATKWNFYKFSPGLVGAHCVGLT
jgi:UDP-N-acetyl-D-glucosamine/UDP-N-acetyl-D-galactosamine dehydrogenase